MFGICIPCVSVAIVLVKCCCRGRNITFQGRGRKAVFFSAVMFLQNSALILSSFFYGRGKIKMIKLHYYNIDGPKVICASKGKSKFFITDSKGTDGSASRKNKPIVYLKMKFLTSKCISWFK